MLYNLDKPLRTKRDWRKKWKADVKKDDQIRKPKGKQKSLKKM